MLSFLRYSMCADSVTVVLAHNTSVAMSQQYAVVIFRFFWLFVCSSTCGIPQETHIIF